MHHFPVFLPISSKVLARAGQTTQLCVNRPKIFVTFPQMDARN
jgi:gamma-glutamyl:cysteine ligase YbdK (ATP-grasp superfamily)